MENTLEGSPGGSLSKQCPEKFGLADILGEFWDILQNSILIEDLRMAAFNSSQ